MIENRTFWSYLLLSTMMCSFLESAVSIETQHFGSINGKEVKKFTIKNKNNQEVEVINYGAAIFSIKTPDKNNQLADIVLGYDDLEGYLSSENLYHGATVGRVANRIKNATFTLDGLKYRLSKNVGEFTLHGGFQGWNSKVWEAFATNNSVVMTLLSEDGDEGFPGTVIASITFKFNDDGEFIIDMKAFTTKPTPINLTNHCYFNLAGHDKDADELYKHQIEMNADRFLITNSENIPTGEIKPVDNSVMDLRKPTTLGDVVNQVPGGGYDNNFCMPNFDKTKINFVAKVVHPESGRFMVVSSNQPGVQFYTSNNLPKSGTPVVLGKGGKPYYKHGSFCLETQNYPDAINHNNFPDSVLRPDDIYQHTVIYKVGVQK